RRPENLGWAALGGVGRRWAALGGVARRPCRREKAAVAAIIIVSNSLGAPCKCEVASCKLGLVESATCRFCGAKLQDVVVDLGMSPLCETFLTAKELDRMEPFYPLRVEVCRTCWLVGLSEYVKVEEIFTEYAYFSSFSTAWLKHAEDYVDMISK